MANSSLEKLKSTLGLGARTNKYRVILSSKGGGPTGIEVDVLAKSTSIPQRSFHEIEVWNQGRLTVIAGDADYSGTWNITFMDDENHTLRKKFLKWMEYIDSAKKHTRQTSSHSDYMGTGKIQQLSTIDNSVKVTYNFEDIWPKNISDTSMSDENSEIVEFSVEFNYTFWYEE